MEEILVDVHELRALFERQGQLLAQVQVQLRDCHRALVRIADTNSTGSVRVVQAVAKKVLAEQGVKL